MSETVRLPIYLDSPQHFLNGFGKEPEKAIEYYEALGIECKENIDDYELRAVLPDGWSEDWSGYWTYVKDEKGRKRFCFFEKLAFYDHDAFTRKERRFNINRNYEFYEQNNSLWDSDADKIIQYRVFDGNDIIFETEVITVENKAKGMDQKTEEARLKRVETINEEEAVQKELYAKCQAFIEKDHPDWKDPLAYWNEEERHEDSLQ